MISFHSRTDNINSLGFSLPTTTASKTNQTRPALTAQELNLSHQRSLSKLRNTFNHIFEKYDRHFYEFETDIIDLQTLKIVKNKGFTEKLPDRQPLLPLERHSVTSFESDEDDSLHPDTNLEHKPNHLDRESGKEVYSALERVDLDVDLDPRIGHCSGGEESHSDDAQDQKENRPTKNKVMTMTRRRKKLKLHAKPSRYKSDSLSRFIEMPRSEISPFIPSSVALDKIISKEDLFGDHFVWHIMSSQFLATPLTYEQQFHLDFLSSFIDSSLGFIK